MDWGSRQTVLTLMANTCSGGSARPGGRNEVSDNAQQSGHIGLFMIEGVVGV